MSKHAEFEASIRELPPVLLEKLKQAKNKKLNKIKLNNEIPNNQKLNWDTRQFFIDQNSDQDYDSTVSALCVLQPKEGTDSDCDDKKVHTFNNLCLAEAITNGKEPRFVCDDQWIAEIGADETEIGKFQTGYESWKSLLLTSVKWLMKSQSEIKLKQHVTVSLGYRQDNFAGDFVDKVCFAETRWTQVFGKLQASTKISEQTLWVLAFLFHSNRDLSKAPLDSSGVIDYLGLKEIYTFVARSLEVRTDNALSFLKISSTVKEMMVFEVDKIEFEQLFVLALSFGIPSIISHCLEKKTKLEFDDAYFENGFFTAMHEDNQVLFDFLLKIQVVANETDISDFLKSVAMNNIKFKNNETYFFKLMAASEKSFQTFISEIVKMDEYADIIKSMERRLILRNPFLNKLSVGDPKDREEFLRKVKRSHSKIA